MIGRKGPLGGSPLLWEEVPRSWLGSLRKQLYFRPSWLFITRNNDDGVQRVKEADSIPASRKAKIASWTKSDVAQLLMESTL